MFFRIILATLLLSCNAIAIKVNLVNMGVTDDQIARAIRPPRPLSVSEVIAEMQNPNSPLSALKGIDELDLGENNITHLGATQILMFAQNLKTLKKLSLYNNRIYEIRDPTERKAFEIALLTLLAKSNFEELDLRVNGIAHASWISDIARYAGPNIEKIKWVNTYK